MKKTGELPFFGSYGFEGETPFRYFFLKEDAQNLEEYKKEIIKCLKYDVLYELLPDHKSGHDTYDTLRPPVSLPVQLDYKTFGKSFHESVRGSHSGELIVTYTLSEDRKTMELTLYDRDTRVERVTMGDEDGPIEYAIVDNIIESKVKVTKGKKLTTKDVYVYQSPKRLVMGKENHGYEESMKVITVVKEKEGIKEFTTEHVHEEVKENKPDDKKGKGVK